MSFHQAIDLIWQKITQVDKLINEKKPWELKEEEAKKILYGLVENIYGKLLII
jgi:methionyl-tRNA synthetase